MTPQIYNGIRVTVNHASAAPGTRGALVETPVKTTLAWQLISPRAELPLIGQDIEFTDGLQTRRATVAAIELVAKAMVKALLQTTS